jgi:hypothetical protein
MVWTCEAYYVARCQTKTKFKIVCKEKDAQKCTTKEFCSPAVYFDLLHFYIK